MALPFQERALNLNRNRVGFLHADTLRTMQNLGTIYCQLERYVEAEDMYWRALMGNVEVQDLFYFDEPLIFHNLSVTLHLQGNYEAAAAAASYRHQLIGSGSKWRQIRQNHPFMSRALQAMEESPSTSKTYLFWFSDSPSSCVDDKDSSVPKHPHTASAIDEISSKTSSASSSFAPTTRPTSGPESDQDESPKSPIHETGCCGTNLDSTQV